MLYRCRPCGYVEYRGILPGATCGLYGLALIGITVGTLLPLVQRLRLLVQTMRVSPPTGTTEAGWSWWIAVPAGVIVGLALIALGVVVLNYSLELIEYLVFLRHRCPKCGARKWSWGFTRGFGL